MLTHIFIDYRVSIDEQVKRGCGYRFKGGRWWTQPSRHLKKCKTHGIHGEFLILVTSLLNVDPSIFPLFLMLLLSQTLLVPLGPGGQRSQETQAWNELCSHSPDTFSCLQKGAPEAEIGFAEDAASLLEQDLTHSKCSVMEGILRQDPRKLKRRKRMWVDGAFEWVRDRGR